MNASDGVGLAPHIKIPIVLQFQFLLHMLRMDG